MDGIGTLFPFTLVYTYWSHYVLRGKVTHKDGYH
jgi:cytochrome d ubiquinol oxidase subunit II